MTAPNASTQALQGVRVIDLTHSITGPYCTKLLADQGADVIKIERPGRGDPARLMPPFFHDEPDLEKSGLFLHLNTNKRSMALNLKTDSGRKILLNLIREADIVVENFSPDVMTKLGLDYSTLEAINPRLTMTSISNFGRSGPYRDYGMSEITMYALGGMMISTGTPDREPTKLALTVEQIYAGTISAIGTMGAYMGAQFHGIGQHLDLALMEIMAASQDRAVAAHVNYQYNGPPKVLAGGRNIMPNGVYPCSDGYVQIFHRAPVWDRACKMIDRPDLIADPYFTAPENFNNNPQVRDEFEVILLEWLLQRTKQEVMEKGQSVGYTCTAVNSIDEVFYDKQLRDREFFVEIDHPVVGKLEYPGAPFRASQTNWQAGRAPLLGEHTKQILSECLGYSDDSIAEFVKLGVV